MPVIFTHSCYCAPCCVILLLTCKKKLNQLNKSKMKTMKQNRLALMLSAVIISMATFSCSKSSSQPGGSNGGTETHIVDSRLVGTWMWSEAGDGAYYDDNGTYEGPAYGLALEYKIGADGNGTCFNHLYSSIGAGTEFTVDISSTGFFESDNQQHFGYFPLNGTYKSSEGTNRALSGAELWNTQTNTGKSFLYQKLEFKTIGGKQCFQVTSSDNVTDTYWKVE